MTLEAPGTTLSSAPRSPLLQSHRPTLGTSHGESPGWGTGLHQDGTRLTPEALFLHDPNDAFHRSNRLDSAVGARSRDLERRIPERVLSQSESWAI